MMADKSARTGDQDSHRFLHENSLSGSIGG